MQLLDTTIMNVALPSIASDLGADSSAQLLMVSVYVLAFACTLITAARLGDMLGRRRVFLAAMSVFVLASLLCGLAQDPLWLVLARAVQGLAAGSMSAQTFALIAGLFPKSRHARVFGIYGATIGLATVSGPLVGGLLIAWDLFGWGWRTIFLVNLPLGLLALGVAWRYLLDARPPTPRRLDPVGAALSALGLLLLIWPLVEGRERGWPPVLITMLAMSVPVLVVFVVYERRLARRGGDPVLRIDLCADRSFTRGAIMVFLFFGTLTSMIFTISLTLQFGFGFSALKAGVTTLPWAVGTGLAAPLAALVYRRIGNLVLPLGMVLFAGSLVALAEVLHREGTDPGLSALAGPLVVGGVGLGLFVASLQTAVLASVRQEQAGIVSGLLPTIQQVGSAIGLSVIGVVFFGLVAVAAPDAVQQQRGDLVAGLTSAGVPAPLIPQVEKKFVDCATEQLSSSHPARVPDGCADLGGGGSLTGAQQQIVDKALAVSLDSARAAAGEAFLQAERRVLWVVGGIGVLLALGSLTLPRWNRVEEDDAVESSEPVEARVAVGNSR
ncbi:MFS transporter [Prescottella defluvii]|uniref:MFS transporter n=1 Tax=Prescottella defluvii TaxID=1323361 RepID=UPI0009DE5E50